MNPEKKFITLQRKAERMSKMGEKTIAKNYKKTLDELRITMARMYKDYEINGQLTFAEMSKYNRLQKLDKEVYHLITGLYKSNSTAIRGTLKGIVEDTYKGSISIVNNELENKIRAIIKPIDVTKTINQEMAGLKWTERMGKHRIDAIYEVQKEIKYGLTKGDTYGTMSNRLKDALETDMGKANRIVRTEGHRCHSQAKEESFETIAKAGVKFKEQWISSKDERVRSYHQELDGVIIERGEMFHSPSGAIGPGPGLMGNAADDIHCRCIKILILE